jgi:RNA polymerase sigma factor (sigma-70 family)
MTTKGATQRAIQRLHGSALACANDRTDAQLLESFVSEQDDAAFEALVLRHGPMVLGVCRRILGDNHDAEDAFQAVFLVLVRKADSVVPRAMVGNWLHGVAFRTAHKARVMNAKRLAREMHVRERPMVVDGGPDLAWHDLLPLLDQELQAMPDKYRAPIVLCDLEGKTRKQAALQLGWPEGTLSSRLALGRKMLARRLERRGLSPRAGAMPLLVTPALAHSIPSSLLAATVQAGLLSAAGKGIAGIGVSASVAALTDAMVKAMLLTKLKLAVAVLLIVGAVIGTSLVAGVGHAPTQQIPANHATPCTSVPLPAQGMGNGEPSLNTNAIGQAVTAANQVIGIWTIVIVQVDADCPEDEQVTCQATIRICIRSAPGHCHDTIGS